MTDKEQIIINGIDYTNALEDYLNDCIVDYCKSAHCDIEMAKDIILFPVAKQIEKLQQEKEKFKQECDELKESNKKAQELHKYFMNVAENTANKNKELENNLHIANTNHESAEKECDRYRKALEEIEKYCNNVLSFTLQRLELQKAISSTSSTKQRTVNDESKRFIQIVKRRLSALARSSSHEIYVPNYKK